MIHFNKLDLLKQELDSFRPLPSEIVSAELEAPEQLASLLNAEIETGWPPGEYDRDAQEFVRDRLQGGGLSAVGIFGIQLGIISIP
ncbi:hypothetical protein ACTVJH_00570 [Desulfoplanes sp. PS50]